MITSFIIEPGVGTAIKTNVIQAYKVSSGGMSPTLLAGDHLLAKKSFALKSGVGRGDIIVFPLPEDPSKDFIKRIVGVGSDVIEIKDKQVYINGVLLEEPYKIHTSDRTLSENIQPRDNFGPVTVPDDSLFVLGDNRDQSLDSRFWGFLKTASVSGKASGIYGSWDKENLKVRWGRIGKMIIEAEPR